MDSLKGWWPLAIAALVAAGGYTMWFSGDDTDGEPATALTESDQAPPTISTTTATTSPAHALPIGGGEPPEFPALPDYISKPLYYEPGTPEAEVEVAFVNAQLAYDRAVARPEVVEPEVELWNTGSALATTDQARQGFTDAGQANWPGPLNRIEIEDITILGDAEAEVESCRLIHSYVLADGDERTLVREDLATHQEVFQMVRGQDDRWRLSDRVDVVEQVADTFGDCLDVTAEAAEAAASR